jgi:hypothetical protein
MPLTHKTEQNSHTGTFINLSPKCTINYNRDIINTKAEQGIGSEWVNE